MRWLSLKQTHGVTVIGAMMKKRGATKPYISLISFPDNTQPIDNSAILLIVMQE
jgi:hypothetical protein